jgi:hypothetical protein
MVDIMRAIIELSRGHSESRMKSVRTLANWERAVRLAREEGRTMTRRLPAWVELTGGGLRLVPDRAAVVKRIFEMARAGLGMTSIVKKLTAEGVPAFGDRVPDEEGHYRGLDGQPFGCGQWRASYVRRILSDRRALGEYQPRGAGERKKGDPIPDYYPRVVSGEEFYAARAAVAGRKNGTANRQGRIGNGVANLFGGLLRHARDGCTYYVACRSENGVTTRMLLNRSSTERHTRAYTFPYETFERCVLSRLREIDPAEIVGAVPVTEVSVLQGELNELRERKAALALQLHTGKLASITTLGEVLSQLETREAELLAKIDDGAERTVAPRSDAWGMMHSLVDVMDAAEDREDVRLRLRAAIRRCVDSVYVLIVPRGRNRLVAVQVHFAEGGKRDYLIWRRPTLANAACGTSRVTIPEQCWVHSFKAADGLDLRDKKDVAKVEGLLQRLDLAAAEGHS